MSANNAVTDKTAVRTVRLGDYIELCDERNTNGIYGPDDVRGVSNTKGFICTKADLNGRNLTTFSIIKPTYFAFNRRTTRNGERLGLGYNDGDTAFICTEDYVVFKVKDEDVLSSCYLYIFFNLNEFDRYVRYDSWGSATEFFNWENMLNVMLPLPSIEVQRELVAVYGGLKALAEENEALLQPLSEACQAFIIDCKKKYPSVKLGEFIEIDDTVNTQNDKYEFLGVNKEKGFMPTNANTDGLDAKKYLVISKGKFVFSGMQTGRDVCIRVALYRDDTPALISPAYTTFKITDEQTLLPQYVMMAFRRDESDRWGWFKSDSSIRSNLDWDRFCEFEIPLPPLEIQQKVVDLYNCYEEAKRIASEAREQLKTLCPALVQKAAHTIA